MTQPNQPVIPCPCCGQAFAYMQRGHQHIVWCGYGPCPSKNGDLGAAAPTREEAAKHLQDAIEAEMERTNDFVI